MKIRNFIKPLAFMLCLPLFFSSCTPTPAIQPSPSAEATRPLQTNNAATNPPSPAPSGTPERQYTKDVYEMIDDYISALSPERKLGMMLMLPVSGTSLSEEEEATVRGIEPCGLILFGNNISLERSLVKYISDIQSVSPLPLFIAADEEGGRVSPLQNADSLEISETVPPAYEMGKHSWSDIYDFGVLLGKRLKKYGFNMNLAPVADIWTNELNTVIGDRAFGTDAATVSASVVPMLSGLKSQGVATVLKHFPGHGGTDTDTHDSSATVDYDEARLNTVEYKPFLAGIEAGADCVMLGHIQAPGVDPEGLPASISPYFVKTVLREQFRFDGIIMTDAMNMGAITENYGADEAAILAVQAGVDIVLMPDDPVAAYEGLKRAYAEGSIDASSLDASVKRILLLKLKLGILSMEHLSEGI